MGPGLRTWPLPIRSGASIMISTISEHPPLTIVSVGQEIRVREVSNPKGSHGVRPTKNEQAIEKEPVQPLTKSDLQESRSEEPVQEALTRLQETLKHVEPRIELSLDKELNQVIFRIFDKESGELIKQIPSEEVLELDRFYTDQSGLFVEEDI